MRHPIYTGLLLAIFGTCLAGGRVWNLSVVVMAALLVIVKLKSEEALLTHQFPDAYPLSAARVGHHSVSLSIR